jgi:hypothetical protein
LVPEAHSRVREVWTRDERRVIDRAIALLARRAVRFQFACGDPACRDPTFSPRLVGGELVLECGHKRRVFSDSI